MPVSDDILANLSLTTLDTSIVVFSLDLGKPGSTTHTLSRGVLIHRVLNTTRAVQVGLH